MQNTIISFMGVSPSPQMKLFYVAGVGVKIELINGEILFGRTISEDRHFDSCYVYVDMTGVRTQVPKSNVLRFSTAYKYWLYSVDGEQFDYAILAPEHISIVGFDVMLGASPENMYVKGISKYDAIQEEFDPKSRSINVEEIMFKPDL